MAEVMLLPELEVVKEVIDENIGTLELNDLEKWTVPSGKGLSFQSSYDSECKELIGVILSSRNEKKYYPDKSEKIPACYSEDGVQGHGEPGGLCVDCPNNVFLVKGEPKACRDNVLLLFIKSGDLIPCRINIPSMSIVDFKKFRMKLTSKGKLYKRTVVRLSIKKAESKQGDSYSKVLFEPLEQIEGKDDIIKLLTIQM